MKTIIDRAFRSTSIALTLFLASTIPSHAQEQTQVFNTNTLMLMLGEHPPGKARFVETKTLAMLKKPVISEGELRYEPPGKLTMITSTPKAESTVIDGQWLTRQADGKTMRLKLDDYPEVAGMIEGIRGSLGGNRMLLEQYYTPEVSGHPGQWRMRLTPKDSRVKKNISYIDIAGQYHNVRSVDIQQADGDSSHMVITAQP